MREGLWEAPEGPRKALEEHCWSSIIHNGGLEGLGLVDRSGSFDILEVSVLLQKGVRASLGLGLEEGGGSAGGF